jgi:hypothetical protein
MGANRNDPNLSSVELRLDSLLAGRSDLELASAYAANSEMSLEIMEDFAAVDHVGFEW